MGRLRQELKQNLEFFKEACKEENTIRKKVSSCKNIIIKN